jgi:hypothetical protein
MQRMLTLLLLALSATAFAEGPARVASLDWMTGTWVHEAQGARVTESWVGPQNGMMVAANLSAWTGGKRFHEFLRIADTPDSFSYYASPGGRPAEEFKLREIGDRRVVFENPEKAFPRRILYWRDGDALMARIEGTVDGAAKSEEWRMLPK